MANSLETRAPFLDHEFVELTARLPPEMKWRPLFQSKWLLRTGLSGLLPKSILRLPKKGFGLPLARWFRNDLSGLLEETVASPKAMGRGYFNATSVRRLIDEHQSVRADHSHTLWALVMLELWHRAYMD
jgi:asparagine synthase (glutamine-hydrolysing)